VKRLTLILAAWLVGLDDPVGALVAFDIGVDDSLRVSA
jgi:hypothetical protein